MSIIMNLALGMEMTLLNINLTTRISAVVVHAFIGVVDKISAHHDLVVVRVHIFLSVVANNWNISDVLAPILGDHFLGHEGKCAYGFLCGWHCRSQGLECGEEVGHPPGQ